MWQLVVWEEKVWPLDTSRGRRKEYSGALSDVDGRYVVP
jgi:hypothetical protein